RTRASASRPTICTALWNPCIRPRRAAWAWVWPSPVPSWRKTGERCDLPANLVMALHLPCALSPPWLSERYMTANAPSIMVVDDDHDLCASLWDLLRDRGYRVCLAHDEYEASAQLGGREFKVVMIDMKLPTGNGASVFHLVRQNNPHARTIFITGHRNEMD